LKKSKNIAKRRLVSCDMKVVIDTNILISAYLKDGTPEAVFLYVLSNNITWLVTMEILLEYESVLRRPKFKVSMKDLDKWMSIFRDYTTVIVATTSARLTRDVKDEKFLSCAKSGHADFLITGDFDFSEASDMGKTCVVSASGFKEKVMGE
jgi:uncharacterized protein